MATVVLGGMRPEYKNLSRHERTEEATPQEAVNCCHREVVHLPPELETCHCVSALKHQKEKTLNGSLTA